MRRRTHDDYRPRWHQRIELVRLSREWARRKFFDMLRAAMRTDDGRAVLGETLNDLLAWRPKAVPPSAALLVSQQPYPDLGRAPASGPDVAPRPIFITARFRSGSTLLWNLFRNIDGCTAYYEPFNERRWFDPQFRGARVDGTHHVDEYWREYDGLSELGAYYDEEWTRRRLYMDEDSWNPAMAAYIQLLVKRARGRAVLQFNRIDFRLAWMRRMFPSAYLVHLYRHPRNQWCSTIGDLASCPPDSGLRDFQDGFYLLTWAADLKHRFPFLDVPPSTHPYRVFYYLWKLSYVFGITWADHSMSFESLTTKPEAELTALFTKIAVNNADPAQLKSLIVPMKDRWPQYASDDWFREHEEACEGTLLQFFDPAHAANAGNGAPGAAGPRSNRPELTHV